ncbi:MAG: hypothetical protein KDJ39_07705, partial [Gammaproteobacteria bacterium]|nr:hypothetical protein [Gammaproteobacteria bacterium]
MSASFTHGGTPLAVGIEDALVMRLLGCRRLMVPADSRAAGRHRGSTFLAARGRQTEMLRRCTLGR